MLQKLVLLVVALLGLSGCADRIGPFVRAVYPNGKGGFIVDRCIIQYGGFELGTLHVKDCELEEFSATDKPPADVRHEIDHPSN
jgi:hypothetical protein